MSKILKYGFVAAVFAATLCMISSAFAQGVDVLRGGGGTQPNYVTDDMLLNADKDPMNWMHYESRPSREKNLRLIVLEQKIILALPNLQSGRTTKTF